MKIRLKFMKTGSLKFIGHLDIMRTFQKIFRQSGIPIAYSEGFSPHQIFSIAAPLAIGVTGEGEYLDLKLESPCSIDEIPNKMNKVCPKGLKIIAAIELDDKEPAAMAIVSGAKYIIRQKESIFTDENIDAFINQDIIKYTKKNKKGKWVETDLKPGIYSIKLIDNEIEMLLSTGSVLNVKPEAVFISLCDFINASYNQYNFEVHRLELYHDDLIPLSIPVVSVF